MSFHLALITGATGGLGAALCQVLHEQGIPLLLTGRDAEKLAKLGNQYSAQTIPCDIRSRAPLLDVIRERTPDLVINNAGFALYGDATSHPTKDQLDIFEVNGGAVLDITLEAARALQREQKSGVILNISSAAAPFSFPGLAVYAAAKAFISALSLSLDAELRPHGICVLTALPGQIATPFASRAAARPLPRHPQAIDPTKAAQLLWKQILSRKPLQIIDWRYRLALRFARLLPRGLVERHLAQEIQGRLLYPINNQ